MTQKAEAAKSPPGEPEAGEPRTGSVGGEMPFDSAQGMGKGYEPAWAQRWVEQEIKAGFEEIVFRRSRIDLL